MITDYYALCRQIINHHFPDLAVPDFVAGKSKIAFYFFKHVI